MWAALFYGLSSCTVENTARYFATAMRKAISIEAIKAQVSEKNKNFP